MPASNEELLEELATLYELNEESLARIHELRSQIRDNEEARKYRRGQIDTIFAELRARVVPQEVKKT